MMQQNVVLSIVLIVTISLFQLSSAWAQASRTWVSGVGDDANPCSRTAPCKTFAGAISKTIAGGEIDVIDPGGFGAVTITKAITIDGGGAFASILVSGTNGIIINAGVADKVVLRNLSFNGVGTGLNGIEFRAGGHLVVEHCNVMGFATNGIFINPSTSGAQTMISHSTLEGNANGIAFSTAANSSGSSATIYDTTISHNNGIAISALVPAGKPGMGIIVDHVLAAVNSQGLAANGNGAFVLVSNSTIVSNGTGVSLSNGGNVTSFKNNVINGNGSDGTPLNGTGSN